MNTWAGGNFYVRSNLFHKFKIIYQRTIWALSKTSLASLLNLSQLKLSYVKIVLSKKIWT